jgi:hypothetical protein
MAGSPDLDTRIFDRGATRYLDGTDSAVWAVVVTIALDHRLERHHQIGDTGDHGPCKQQREKAGHGCLLSWAWTAVFWSQRR